ncbi:hypothetical protein [Paenibacillus sp. KS-LC4]|uniref:hypothetical protein n=1 Tax=Paenibacillus sp. KS-LC4 TaxID=2979727 RepID=UPI0030CCE38A
MLKKFLKTSLLTIALTLTVSSAVSAMPIDQDITEPNNNTPLTTYQYSQNVFTSWIQSSTDADFWNFISPKTGLQEIWLLPPAGTTYLFAVYDYPGGTPLAFTYANSANGISSLYVNLQTGKKYTVLVMSLNGTYDENNPYYIGHPLLFPF